MKNLRSINTFFWSDPYIEKLNPDGKLLFLYLLTNINTNIIGVYEITDKKIFYDTDLDSDIVKELLEKFRVGKKIYFINNYVILTNFTKNQSYNPKMLIGALDMFSKLPQYIIKFIFNDDTLYSKFNSLFSADNSLYSKFNSLSHRIEYKGNRIEDEFNLTEIENGTLNQMLNDTQKIKYFGLFKKQFKTDLLLENTQRGLNKTGDKCESLIDKFLAEIKMSEEYLQGLKKMKVYFKNWSLKLSDKK